MEKNKLCLIIKEIRYHLKTEGYSLGCDMRMINTSEHGLSFLKVYLPLQINMPVF